MATQKKTGRVTAAEQRRISAKWIDRLGGGFHPDTPGDGYVPRLTLEEQAEYEADRSRLFDGPRCPYSTTIDAAEAAGVWPRPPYT